MQPVGVERLGDLFADELTHPLAGDRPRQPGQQPSVRQRVVGRLAAQPDGAAAAIRSSIATWSIRSALLMPLR